MLLGKVSLNIHSFYSLFFRMRLHPAVMPLERENVPRLSSAILLQLQNELITKLTVELRSWHLLLNSAVT
jgi:hypothetical protein